MGDQINYAVDVVCDCISRLVLYSVDPFAVQYSDVSIKRFGGGGNVTFAEKVRVVVKRPVSASKRMDNMKGVRKVAKRSK